MDCDLFGGFFTALNSVAKAMGVDNISSLVIDQALYTFSKVFNLIFIIRTSAEAKQERIRKLLGKITQVFFKHFPPEQYWEKKSLAPGPNAVIKDNDLIGYIAFKPEKYQKLDADYAELFANPLDKMKTTLWS